MPTSDVTHPVEPAAPPVHIERRNKQILFKVTTAEKEKYLAAAKRRGKNFSEWIRATLDQESAAE